MTYQESTQRLRGLAQDLKGNNTPVFFLDRAFRGPLSKPAGTVQDYLDQLAKKPPSERATSLSANGLACEVLDVVAAKAEDGRDCVVFEYDSIGKQ